MQGYILAVLGIVIISVLVEIILPSGQTAKYIRSILAVFVVYVLVNPIISFLNNDFDLKKYLTVDQIKLNHTLLDNLYQSQIQAKQTDLENKLKEEGYLNVEVVLVYEIVEEEIKISKVKVDIKNLVITSNNTNINKYQYIRQVVMSQLAVKEEDIVFE